MRDSHAGTAVLLCGGAAAEVAGWREKPVSSKDLTQTLRDTSGPSVDPSTF